MSKDIQIISVVDDLQVLEVTEVDGASPRTIRVVGKRGFNSAQRVEINDFGVDDFTLVSDTVLLVAPPDLVFGDVLVTSMDVVVIAGELTSAKSARLFFGSTRRTRTVTGVQKLVQQVTKIMLTRLGSNRFNLADGGSLTDVAGNSLTSGSKGKISTGVARAVSLTKEQLFAAQARSNLPSTERLLNLEVVSVNFDSVSLEVSARIQLTSYAGESITVPLVL